MRRARAFLVRFTALFRRRDADLSAEIESHLAFHIDDNLRAGMSPEEARRYALLRFGGIEPIKERYRDQRGVPVLDDLFQDVRYGLRQLSQHRAFTIVAITALALGVGATIAIFSVVNTVLLRPLPIRDADRFVLITTVNSSDGDASSPAKFVQWRAESSILQDTSAILNGTVNYTGGDALELWHSARVSTDAFRCWGMPILRGRGFSPGEEVPNGPRVAVISEEMWASRFTNDPQVLGKTISLNSEPYTIVGVVGTVAPTREFGPTVDVYVPFQIDPNTTEQGNYFDVVARLKPGVTLDQVRARLRTSTTEYRLKFPKALGPQETFTATPIREALVVDTRPLLMLLLGAVSLVLLIACANVANLLLARATVRKREIAIRAAIGADRGRVIRQLLSESLLLSFAGGAAGLCLGYAGIHALLLVNTAALPLVGANGAQVIIDWRVATFALAVSLLTGMIFGLYPAFQSSRADLSAALRESSVQTGASRKQNRMQAGLVIGEVCLAVILLIGAALLIRSFSALYAVNSGLQTKNVVTMDVLMTGPKYAKTDAATSAVRRSLKAIRSIRGVEAAGVTCCLPLAQGTYNMNFEIVGRPHDQPNQDIGWATVSPGYFAAYNIPLRRGRDFMDRDDRSSPPVVLINETMAHEYWHDSDPLGERLRIGDGTNEFKDEPVRQIIGVVGDVRDEGLSLKSRPVMYIPQAQLPDTANTFFLRLMPLGWVIRVREDPARLIPSIQAQLERATGLPVTGVSQMDRVVWAQTSRERFNLLLMSVFGSTALLLAAIGLYGLMIYTVSQQTREIGIRLVLGEEATRIRQAVLQQGLALTAVGIGIGLAAAWGLSHLLEGLLFGVRTHDPAVFAAVPLILGIVALLAIWPAAHRASRVDPARSLRCE